MIEGLTSFVEAVTEFPSMLAEMTALLPGQVGSKSCIFLRVVPQIRGDSILGDAIVVGCRKQVMPVDAAQCVLFEQSRHGSVK